LTAFVCDHCQRDFESEEARCPKCLKKRTVRERTDDASEVERVAAGEIEPSTRMGLQIGLVGTSLVVSMVLFGVMFWCLPELEQLRCVYPAGIGLSVGSIVSIRVAPRFAVEDPRPLIAYAGWLGLSALVGTSILVCGLLAIWMASEVSTFVTVVLAVVLWLGLAIPALGYYLRVVAGRESAEAERAPGKWR
jgi:DNA-directed RNA polymerase subunit RPC12/RpoP